MKATDGIGALELAQWRRLTAEMYAMVREVSETNPKGAWQEYRKKRDEMFRSHPQSPLEHGRRVRFSGLAYYPYNPSWRFRAPIAPIEGGDERSTTEIDLAEGKLRYRRIATVALRAPAGSDAAATLTLYWIEGYGGGLFLPFRDRTNGDETYGGGRYLYDTIKGADLGASADSITLDFNFGYNPSCAYSATWVCPLAPAENALPFALEAGERAF
jgi:hypothetical protein